MASQGPRFPGTTANLIEASTLENKDAWANPGNIVSDNATEAAITAASYDSPDISQLLVASNFTFTIPGGATIDGIIVEIDRRSIVASSGKDFRVQLATGTTFASLVGNNKAVPATIWPTATGVATYGGAADKWGATLTEAQVNAAGFAVMLSCQANIANADVGVDYIRVTVHYTAASFQEGAAAVSATASATAVGGLLLTGAAAVTAAASVTAASGLLLTGAASVTAAATITGAAGLVLEASASVTASATATGDGELISPIINGSASVTASATASGLGGLLLTGDASVSASAAASASGDRILAGSASVTASASATAGGMLQVGGSAAVTAMATLGGAGSMILAGAASVQAVATASGSATEAEPEVHEGAASVTAHATAAAGGELQVGTTGMATAGALVTAAGSLELAGAASTAAWATVIGGGSLELAGAASALASAQGAASGVMDMGGAALALALATATGSGEVGVFLPAWSMVVLMQALRGLLEPTLAEEDPFSEPFGFRTGGLYLWEEDHRDEEYATRGGPITTHFEVNLVYMADGQGEQARGRARRAVTQVLSAKMDAYLAALRSNLSTDEWDHVQASVDHDRVRTLDGRGFALRLSGHRMRV